MNIVIGDKKECVTNGRKIFKVRVLTAAIDIFDQACPRCRPVRFPEFIAMITVIGDEKERVANNREAMRIAIAIACIDVFDQFRGGHGRRVG